MQNIVADVIHEGKQNWGWYMALGIALIVVGFVAIGSDVVGATLASMIVLGALILVAGIAQIAGAFVARGAGNIILLLLVGILDIVVGWMLIQHPDVGALTTTLLLATLFVVGGAYRFVSALWLRFPNYGWAAFGGAVTFVLGLMLWNQWPTSALWFIGFAVGLNFIFAGVAWASLALRLKAA
ncbi:MAG TPA: DUF308 domain-containing protein [Candidatus Binatia bacterium]|nr:DUF308 domain-containing protein [Candidatus Binatia bacterium]